MQFQLFFWPYGDARRAMCEHPVFKPLEYAPGVFIVRWPSVEFDVLKRIWPDWNHVVARLECSVSGEMLTDTKLFEVWKTETSYGPSGSDQQYLQEHTKLGPSLKTADEGVKFFPEIRLTRPAVKPKEISSLDCMIPVNFVDSEEASIWRTQNFTGLEFGHVRGHRGQKIRENISLIVPTNVMAPMKTGQNVFVESFVHNGVMTSHPLVTGFIVYQGVDVLRSQDFNFTREPLCNFGYPQILVWRRFVDFYRKRGLKGWVFRPVLGSESLWYEEFAETFGRFMLDWRTGHPQNRFSGP